MTADCPYYAVSTGISAGRQQLIPKKRAASISRQPLQYFNTYSSGSTITNSTLLFFHQTVLS